MAATLDACLDQIADIQRTARTEAVSGAQP
jgi:hypothetical protein